MSIWTLEVDFSWPNEVTARAFENLLREVVDPLNRENVIVSGVRLVLKDDE